MSQLKAKSKSDGANIKILLKYLQGVGVGAVLCALSELSVSVIYLNVNSQVSLIFFTVFLLFAFSSFLCGYITQKRTKEKGIKVGAISGFILASAVLVLNIIIAGLKDISYFVVVLPIIITAASSFGGIVAANRKKRY